MVRREFTVSCPGCGTRVSFPIASLRRDNAHCASCGGPIPLRDVKVPVLDQRKPKKRKKQPYRRR